MSLSSRPNVQTILTCLVLLQVVLGVPLQETSKGTASPQNWLQNACMLIMCGSNKGDPGREVAIPGRQQLSGPSGLLASSAPNRDTLWSGTSELELLKLQLKELRIQMDIFKATFIKIQQAALAPNGRIVGDKMFKRDDSKGSFQSATTKCSHLKGKLALPRNADENGALQEIVAWRKEQAILGITYNTTEKKFEDLNGKPLLYFNWAPGEPNNLGYEKCVEMHPNGQWHNRICDLGWPIVCEFDI